MPVVTLLGAKGGVGVSLIATNLGLLLAQRGQCLLLDLHPQTGADDLLLDLSPERSWADLLPVAEELTPRHLELAATLHPTGLRLLAAPQQPPAQPEKVERLLRALSRSADWLLVDAPPPGDPLTAAALAACDALLLVTTPDPPALRAAHRLAEGLSAPLRARTALVLNQVGRDHPVPPTELATAVGLPLLAALPPDPEAVGNQVHFGRALALDGRATLAREVARLASRLVSALAPRQQSGEAPVAADAPETWEVIS